MLSLLLVGKDLATLSVFADELSRKEGVRVSKAVSVEEAWGLLGNCRVDVVVIDKELAGGTALSFVKELTKQHPLINCAMVSTLSPKDFHEAAEGLGVFMQLPFNPGAEEVAKMMQILESINALMSK